MNLAEYERALTRVCLSHEPNEADVRALGGDAERWRMYRRMIRTRMLKMAQGAYARSARLLGDRAFEASHDRFLAQPGPRSPMIREVVADFGTFALEDPALEVSDYVRDLLRFEQTKWALAYQPATRVGPLREFDFEGRPALHPVFRILELGFAVHREANDDRDPVAQHTVLFVYRPEGARGVRWWEVDAFGAALFQHFQAGVDSVPDAVRQAAEATGENLDAALLERLSTSLALAVERGLLLGTHA